MAQTNPICGWLKPTEKNKYHSAFAAREIYSEDEYSIVGIDINGEDVDALKEYWYFEPITQENNQYDPVNNPSHYQLLPGVEVRDVIKVLVSKIADKGVLTEMQISDYVQMMQYLLRFMEKGGVEDIKKAKVYLEWILEDA